MKVSIFSAECLTILFAGVLSSSAAAQTFRIVHESNEHIIVEINAAELQQKIEKNKESSALRFSVAGFEENGELGGPSYPSASRYIAIPEGRTPKLSTISKKSKNIDLKIPPTHYAGIRRHCASELNEQKKDAALFEQFQSPDTLVIEEISYLGAAKVALLRFNPLTYAKGLRSARWTSRLIVRIDFAKEGKAKQRSPVNTTLLTKDDRSFYRTLVLNAKALPDFPRNSRLQYDLILNPAEYNDAIDELVSFKEEQGRGVVRVNINQQDSNQIKALIAQHYQNSNPPAHTLLIGNISQIPSFRHNGFWSDYKYALLDQGNLPDISLARLAPQSTEELRNMIKKIIAREKSARPNESFLLTSGFETEWCQKNLEYIETHILDNSRATLEVTKKYASQKHRTDAVIEAYNANPNVIIHDGHGDQNGMTELAFQRAHLARLNNTVFPIVMDIACLNSKWPSNGATETNFADRLSALSQAGAAGILAATDYAGGHDLFRHILRAAIYDEQNQSEPYHDINEFGTMLLYGKAKYLEQYSGNSSALTDNHMFIYHGDPATTMFKGEGR